MLHIPLADLDQLRQLIETLLEQNIDITPILIDTVFEMNQAVINGDHIKNYDQNCKQKNAEQNPDSHHN
jgi:hypothetical protein